MNFKFYFLIVFLCAFLSACGGGSDGSDNGGGGGNNKPQNPNFINWDLIAAEFHPTVEDYTFATDGAEKINVDIFGINRDVQVIYKSDMAPDEAVIKVFRVWKEQASWGYIDANWNGTNLDLRSYGSYRCSIRIKNGQITELDGGCNIKVQVILPTGAEIEVYSSGQLITN